MFSRSDVAAGLGRRRRHGPRREAANSAALESLVLVVFLVIGAAFVADMGPPASSLPPTRDAMEQATQDLLGGFKDLPLSERYSTLLEKAVAKAVVGNTSAFENLVERSMPPETECRLWIDNGHARRQVAGPSERLARESVSASRLWRPTWAYAFAVPGFDLISELQPMQVQGYQVSQGSLVKEQGLALNFTLTTDRGVYGKAAITAARPEAPTASLFLLNESSVASFSYLDTAGAPQSTALEHLTAPGPLAQPDSFTVPADQDELVITSRFAGTTLRYTMTFTAPGGASWDVSAERPGWANLTIPFPTMGSWDFAASGQVSGAGASAELWVNSTRTGTESDWTVVVREEAGKAIPAGTVLNVTLPGVLTGLERTSRAQAGWTNIAMSDTLASEPWVRAEFAAPLQGAQRALTIKAGIPLDGDALYGMTATLSNGSAARATFVLGSTLGIMSIENTLDHDLYASVPKPHASGVKALWGAAFAYPTAAGGAERATRLDVRATDGRALFGSVEGLSPPGTWTRMGPDHVRWDGFQTVQPNRALAFAFNVTTLADAMTEDEPAVTVPLAFGGGPMDGSDDAVFVMTEQERPYVYAMRVPPPTDLLGDPQAGFAIPAGSGPLTRGNGTFNITQVQRGMLVKGEPSYGVSAWGTLGSVAEALRTGMARSHLDISRQHVRIGEEVNVSIDFEGLFDEVELAGMPMTAWNVEVKVFDPAQPFVPFAEMLPSLHGKFGASPDISLQTVDPNLRTIVKIQAEANEIFSRARGNITLIIPGQAFYGPHAVVVQANFMLEDPISGTSFLQSVRLLGVIDVVPDAGQNASALYWAVLECWLPDW